MAGPPTAQEPEGAAAGPRGPRARCVWRGVGFRGRLAQRASSSSPSSAGVPGALPQSRPPLPQACPWSSAVCRVPSVRAWHLGAGDHPSLPSPPGGVGAVACGPARRCWQSRPCVACPEDAALRRAMPALPPCPGRGWETLPPRPLLCSLNPPPGPPAPAARLSGREAASELHIKCSCTETWPQSNYTRKQEEPFRLIWLFRPVSLGSLGGMPRRAAVRAGSGVGAALCPPESQGVGGRGTGCLSLGQSAGNCGSPRQGGHGAVGGLLCQLEAWRWESESFLHHPPGIRRAQSREAPVPGGWGRQCGESRGGSRGSKSE